MRSLGHPPRVSLTESSAYQRFNAGKDNVIFPKCNDMMIGNPFATVRIASLTERSHRRLFTKVSCNLKMKRLLSQLSRVENNYSNCRPI
jgi:hypothetical protein